MTALVVRSLGPFVAAGLAVVAIPEASSNRGGIDLALAGGLLTAGAVAWFLERWLPGCAAILAGAALGLATAGDAEGASARALALGLAAAPLIAPLLALAIVRAPAAWIALLGGVAAGPGRALFYDPFLDPGCTRRCLISPFVVTHDNEFAGDLLLSGTLLAALALTALVIRPHRRWQVAVVAAAAWSLVLERGTGLVLVAAAVTLLILVIEIVDLIERRRRVTVLARTLATSGDAQTILRRELRDDGLTVSYWLGDEQRFVTADGRPEEAARHDQETTVIRSDGELLARVHHEARAAVRELAAAIDGSTRLALDNERLGAQVAVQLAALQESRARIVARADATRREIERDVHDGAQQHVLALGLELNVALAKLGPDDPGRTVVETCIAETNLVLDELRDLSHGIYPASLEAGGLAHGLRTLASRSRHPVVIEDVPARRFGDAIERAAFQVVSDAADRAAGPVDVRVESGGDEVRMHVAGAALPTGVVADRVAAAGGSLAQVGDTIVVTFPCAS